MNMSISPFKTLDPRQTEFVRLFVEGAHPRQAALGAGYARATAEATGEQLLQRPNIALAIARAARPRLMRSLPMALATLDFLTEKAVSERVRLEAAKAICDRVGLVAKPQDPESELEKPAHEMSLEELRAKLAQYEIEVANRAIDITPMPDPVAVG